MKMSRNAKLPEILLTLAALCLALSCGDDILVAPSGETPPPATATPSTPPSNDCSTPQPLTFDVSSETPAELLLVVDRSGSMTESGQWMELQRSLEELLQSYDDSIAFGLLLFPAVGFNACGVSDVSVSPSLRVGPKYLTSSTPLNAAWGNPNRRSPDESQESPRDASLKPQGSYPRNRRWPRLQ